MAHSGPIPCGNWDGQNCGRCVEPSELGGPSIPALLLSTDGSITLPLVPTVAGFPVMLGVLGRVRPSRLRPISYQPPTMDRERKLFGNSRSLRPNKEDHDMHCIRFAMVLTAIAATAVLTSAQSANPDPDRTPVTPSPGLLSPPSRNRTARHAWRWRPATQALIQRPCDNCPNLRQFLSEGSLLLGVPPRYPAD